MSSSLNECDVKEGKTTKTKESFLTSINRNTKLKHAHSFIIICDYAAFIWRVLIHLKALHTAYWSRNSKLELKFCFKNKNHDLFISYMKLINNESANFSSSDSLVILFFFIFSFLFWINWKKLAINSTKESQHNLSSSSLW